MMKLLTSTYGKNLRWQNTNAKDLQEALRGNIKVIFETYHYFLKECVATRHHEYTMIQV